MALSPDELERYARHIVVPEVGGPGQAKLIGAKVLVIGAGGLGAPALLYLAAAGVGTIGICDNDKVSLSNLQRQVVHTTARVGEFKTKSARATLEAIIACASMLPTHSTSFSGMTLSPMAAIISPHGFWSATPVTLQKNRWSLRRSGNSTDRFQRSSLTKTRPRAIRGRLIAASLVISRRGDCFRPVKRWAFWVRFPASSVPCRLWK